MATKVPQVARVASGTTGVNTLSALRKIPIIFIPGTMGTRLIDPATKALVWNPTGFPFTTFGFKDGQDNLAADVDRIADLSQPLEPDTLHPWIPLNSSQSLLWQTIANENRVKNYLHVVPDFYGELVTRLATDLKPILRAAGYEPAIYCCGYDWRVDNAISAQCLADLVSQASSECDNEKAILVAHSMGGLIARYYCKNLGGESNVRAVFLLASPSLGAVDAYASLRTGLDVFEPVRIVTLFLIRAHSRDFIRKIPSVWQLLPNYIYCHASPAWATFDPAWTGYNGSDPQAFTPLLPMQFSDLTNPVLFFQDIYTGLQDLPEQRANNLANFQQAWAFQQALMNDASSAVYMHPATYVAYCGDNPATASSCSVTFDSISHTDTTVIVSDTNVTKSSAGDKTVPSISAYPQNMTTAPFAGGANGVLNVAGTEHQKLPSDPHTINWLLSIIPLALQGTNSGGGP